MVQKARLETSLRKTQAIVLRKIDFSETSQVLHFLTKDCGKISAIAKGAKRKKSAFLGALDLLILYEITYKEKLPGNLDLLTSAVGVRDYRGITGNLDGFTAANYFLEFVDELVADGQKITGLFELLEDSLTALTDNPNVGKIIFTFEAKALKMLGFLPRVDDCAICNGELGGNNLVVFAAKHGGAVCPRCRVTDQTKIWARRQALKEIGSFLNGASVRLQNQTSLHIRRVLSYYVSNLMQKAPLTLKMVNDIYK